ncbi:MAG: hypothetical protein DRJ21_01945 [Candidatus Methanomethylicota archaeon]|uniref:Uncharacterized protein n=1 Tax=Thermoproteota archaeon TaxID=2056631 RepID=A0A497ETT3_9CREN|nr:MAG: hypothetical protein DRJ21_01945 [Candidatus Verstraetearchaeota archaeon]
MERKYLRYLGYISVVLGIIYTLTGIIEMINSLVLLVPLFIFSRDFMGGFVSITIGLVFIYGIRELLKEDYRGLSFVLVGLIMAVMFAGLYTLILIANAVECYILGNEEFAGWTILNDLRMELMLGWLLVPVLIWLVNTIRREEL